MAFRSVSVAPSAKPISSCVQPASSAHRLVALSLPVYPTAHPTGVKLIGPHGGLQVDKFDEHDEQAMWNERFVAYMIK